MIYKVNDTSKAAGLWEIWEESLIWSAMQGMMGEMYADDPEHPTCSMVILGDFAYFTGIPNLELAQFVPDWCTQDFIILVPENEAWGKLIEQYYGEKATKVSRYAIKKERGIFDRTKLQQLMETLPPEYEMKWIDQELFTYCKDADWARDFVDRYKEYELYEQIGLGVGVLYEGEMVAGVSSYSSFKDGIEIEIVTQQQHRRRGLATACAAKILSPYG